MKWMKVLYITILLFTISVQAQDEEKKKKRRMGVVTDRKRKKAPAPERTVTDSIVEDQIVEEPELPEPEPVVEIPVFPEDRFVGSVMLLPEEPAPSKVDILFVVDNSKSMNPIWKTIDQKMSSFVESLSAFDWHLAFITSGFETENKTLMPLEYSGEVLDQFILSSDQENHVQIFRDTLLRNKKKPCQWPPYCGKTAEQPIRALQNYLITNFDLSFVREDAALVVVIMTDNKENKDSLNVIAQPEEFIDLFHELYNDQSLTVHTFTITDKECSKKIRSLQFPYIEAKPSPLIRRLGTLTQGQNFSLCLETYDDVTEAIVQSLE